MAKKTTTKKKKIGDKITEEEIKLASLTNCVAEVKTECIDNCVEDVNIECTDNCMEGEVYSAETKSTDHITFEYGKVDTDYLDNENVVLDEYEVDEKEEKAILEHENENVEPEKKKTKYPWYRFTRFWNGTIED